MDVTTQFEDMLSFSLKRTLHFHVGFYANLLANLINIIRYILKFEMLRVLQKKLYRFYREQMAIARSLPPVTHPEIEKIPVVVPVTGENIQLRGDLYLPVEAAEGALKVPVVLIRTPYDKDSPLMGSRLAYVFAERGYGCLVQDTRGRFGSGGDFFPIKHEVKDGTATVEWLRKQSWCNGKIGTYGVSYLGLTSYAAAGGGQKVDACCPVMASSRLYPIIYHNGQSFAFDLVIRWLWLVMTVMHDRNPFSKLFKVINPQKHLESALHPVGKSPVHHRDLDIVGKELEFYRQVMESHELGHDFWTEKDILCDLSKKDSSPPLSIVAGWHDMFVAQSFKDLEVASKVKTDAPLSMICGPWSHWDFLQYSPVGFKAALELFAVQLKGEQLGQHDDYIDKEAQMLPRPTRVIVHVLHSETRQKPKGQWLHFRSWPPVSCTKQVNYYLGAGGHLDNSSFIGSKFFTEQVYDPRNPTPNYGGPGFDWFNSGRKAQNELEGRDDVLVFSSASLRDDLMVVGEVEMQVFLWSDNPHTDVFVKLCDVDGNTGKSMNVMEKMTRLSPKTHQWDSEGFLNLTIDMGPIAVLFKKGNKIRIHVSGAAHPLYLRHTGTPDHISMEMKPALRRIYHSQDRPTRISLPVLTT